MQSTNLQTGQEIANQLIAESLATSGFIPDPIVTAFLQDTSHDLAKAARAVVAVGTGPSSVANTPPVTGGPAINQEAIALFMLKNQHLSVNDVANAFSINPSTVTRLLGTDGFTYILAEEARKAAITNTPLKTQLENRIQAAAFVAIERLIERLQTVNDATQLLKMVTELSQLIGLGAKDGPSIQINQFGVNGDHLRFAVKPLNGASHSHANLPALNG